MLNPNKRGLLYYYIDCFYAIFLKHSRDTKKFPLINNDDIKKIKQIEKEAYSEKLYTYTKVNCVKELVERYGAFNEYQIYHLLFENWYIILLLRHDSLEILDLADRTKHCPNFIKAYYYMFKNFKRKTVITDAKEDTSYQILLKLKEKNRIKIFSDFKYVRNGSVFHRVILKSCKVKYKKI